LAAGEARGERVAIRVDFRDPAAFSLESYVLRLRAGLGQLVHRWPAFDLAFSVYWERAHPGEPLEEFISRDSMLRRAARAVGLSDQVAGTVGEVVGSAVPGVVSATHRLTGLLYDRARRAIVRHRTLRRCELLTELLEADADQETLSFLPYLLAWDLDRLEPPHPRVVVFLDTFEQVNAQNSRDMERWVQRSAFLMPNVLFVVTGRDRLDWGDDARRGDGLDFTGPQRWPHLSAGHVGGDPRQHLVGFLSERDAHSYLESALTDNGQPAIPAPIRQRIVAASGGLPLYLDLAVTTYLDLATRNTAPSETDFGQPLPAVVTTIMRDLEREERDLLRSAALVDSFDLDMLRAACPDGTDAVLRRFRDRPFLEVDPSRPWPYSLHATLRDAVRQADVDLRDSWSRRERAAVAARIADHLARYARTAGDEGDRSGEIAAFGQALQLAIHTGQFFDWLVDAAERLLRSGSWDLSLPRVQADPAAALVEALAGAGERRTGNVDTSIDQLTRTLSRGGLTDSLRRFLLLHRAHARRVAGRYADAAHDYQTLVEPSGRFAQEARYWLADYQFLDGQFTTALAALAKLDDGPADLRGEVLRLQGHVFRVNALFDRAEAHYRMALELARKTANPAAEGKALTDLVQTLSWCRPDEARRLHPDAAAINDGLRNKVELVKLHAALAVAMVNQGERAAAAAEIDAGTALTEQCRYPGGLVWCWVARTLLHVKAGDTEAARQAAREVTRIADELGGNRFWGETARRWAGIPDQPADAETQWIDGPAAAGGRWRAVALAG
jgi:tetratricopeptide (TPR) repeat protein